MLRALIFILPLALAIYACIDCVTTADDEARYLPKVVWVFLILLFPVAGSIVWFAVGKPRKAPAGGRTPSEWHRDHRTKWVAPDDNPDFLKSLKDENEKDQAVLKDWEADLRRREEELRKEREQGEPGGERDGERGGELGGERGDDGQKS